MLTFHVIPLFLVIASEAWNLKVCACAMILDSSLRSATFRMTECQHYLVRRRTSRGFPFPLDTPDALPRATVYARVPTWQSSLPFSFPPFAWTDAPSTRPLDPQRSSRTTSRSFNRPISFTSSTRTPSSTAPLTSWSDGQSRSGPSTWGSVRYLEGGQPGRHRGGTRRRSSSSSAVVSRR